MNSIITRTEAAYMIVNPFGYLNDNELMDRLVAPMLSWDIDVFMNYFTKVTKRKLEVVISNRFFVN